MASIGTPTVTGERSYSVSCSGLEEGKNYRLYGLKAGQTVSNGYSSFSANATASGSARFSCWVSEGDTVAVVSKLGMPTPACWDRCCSSPGFPANSSPPYHSDRKKTALRHSL